MGLCLRNEGFLEQESKNSAEGERLIHYALDRFNKSLNIFKQIKINENTRNLWISGILSSKAKCYEYLSQKNEAILCYEEAEVYRRRIYSQISFAQPTTIYQNFLAESYIHKIRLARLKGTNDSEEVKDTIKEIENKRQRIDGYLWTVVNDELEQLRRPPTTTI